MADINTSGGAGVGRDVNSGGGDFSGRDHVENHYYERPPVPAKLPPDHPYKQYTLADVVAVLIGDDLTGTPGLVARVIAIEKELAQIHEERRPAPITWFQIISLIVLTISTIAIIVMLGVFFSGMYR